MFKKSKRKPLAEVLDVLDEVIKPKKRRLRPGKKTMGAGAAAAGGALIANAFRNKKRL